MKCSCIHFPALRSLIRYFIFVVLVNVKISFRFYSLRNNEDRSGGGEIPVERKESFVLLLASRYSSFVFAITNPWKERKANRKERNECTIGNREAVIVSVTLIPSVDKSFKIKSLEIMSTSKLDMLQHAACCVSYRLDCIPLITRADGVLINRNAVLCSRWDEDVRADPMNGAQLWHRYCLEIISKGSFPRGEVASQFVYRDYSLNSVPGY